MERDRRQFLKTSGIVLSIAVAGDVLLLSPASAHAAGLPYQVLSADEVSTLEALAEALVPGAREAGVAQYIDKQLAAAPRDNLLMLKYLGVSPGDFTGFYRGGLSAAGQLAKLRFDRPWSSLDTSQASILLADMAADQAKDWNGPPSSFFHFVIRSDACDVVYGTEAGFGRIDIPYMAHIEPPRAW
jgi:hypothetical protein